MDRIFRRTLHRAGQRDRRRAVAMRVSSSLLLTRVSTGLIIRILVGLISGTVGCAPTKSRVILSTTTRKRDTMVQMDSSNPNVPSRTGRGIFRVFSAKRGHVSSDHHDLKLKLTLYHAVVTTRNNAVALSSGAPRNYVFAFALPLKRISLRRWALSPNYKKQYTCPRPSCRSARGTKLRMRYNNCYIQDAPANGSPYAKYSTIKS